MGSWKFSNLGKIVLALAVIALIATVRLLESVSESKEDHLELKREVPKNVETSVEEEEKGEFLKIFHLDLKGAPPKINFLMNVLPVIREAGANAILVEYEDMFPFSGRLVNVSARNAYSLKEVRKLVEFLEGMKMEVIPLVQSFGHLEYVLKLAEFQHLREVEEFPQEICPSRKEAVNLIKELIRQVMEVHKNSRYIHLGCDEVRHLGVCPRCSKTNPKKIFSNHVTKIAIHVQSHYPGVTPLIWDDMLRHWTYDDMTRSGLGESVEPVVWVYGNNIFLLVPPFIWNIYQRTFPRVWVASAFKGAFGERELLPNLTLHLENNLSWMRVLTEEEKEVTFPPRFFSGIFLTGWSRYDHFAVLCELLPVGIPSLLLNLLFLDSHSSKAEKFSRWLNFLGCPKSLREADAGVIEGDGLFQSKLNTCSFPGRNLYSGVSQYMEIKARLELILRKIDSSGWFSRYNLEKNFTSPWRLAEMFPNEGFAGESLRRELSLWKTSFIPLMRQYFDEWTTSEWEEQNVKLLENKLERIRSEFYKLIRRRTWPRRPLG